MRSTILLLALLSLVGCKKNELYTIQSSADEFYVGETYTLSLDRNPKKKVIWLLDGVEVAEGETFQYSPKKGDLGDIKCYQRKEKNKTFLCEKKCEIRSWGESLTGFHGGLTLINNYENEFFFGAIGLYPKGNSCSVTMRRENYYWGFTINFDRAFTGKISGNLKKGYNMYTGPDPSQFYEVNGTVNRKGDIVTFDFAFDTIQFHADYIIHKKL